MNKRPAFTLIEMLVVIAILSVVLMLSAATLIALFRVERQFAADMAHDRSIARLASQLRADAHSAVSAKANGACEFELSDGRSVRYAFASPAISREVRRGDQLEHRDSFVLARHASAAFSLDASAQHPTVVLHIEAKNNATQSQTVRLRPLAIVAAVDLHHQRPRGESAP